MKIGMKAPAIRVPCIKNNTITFSRLAAFREKKFALCCMPDLHEADAWFLETQAREFEQFDSTLVGLICTDRILGVGWARPLDEFSLPLFVDPMSRLQRMLSLSPLLRPKRSETLIFDERQCLKFRLIHDLNLKGFSAVMDIVQSEFLQGSPGNILTPPMTIHSFLQTTDPKIPIDTIS